MKRAKGAINRLLQRAGYHLISVNRIGVKVELDLLRLCSEKPMACMLDVGANVGQTAMRFHKAFPACEIHSFEPVPQTFEKMVRKVQGINKIHPVNLGIGAAQATVQMCVGQVSEENSLLNSVGEIVQVQIDSLDNYCKFYEVPTIDLLKIDVEGYEMQALAGAERLFQESRVRFVYVECELSKNGTPHTPYEQLKSALQPYGFSPFAYYAEAFSTKYLAGIGNVLFVHGDSLPQSASGKTRNIY